MSRKLNLEEMLSAINKFVDATKPFNNLFSPRQFPLEIGGMKIIEHTPPAKLRLSENIEMSDEFRNEINAWLIDMFGYQGHLMKPHEFMISREFGFIVARPEGIELIKNSITQVQHF